jgi:hypothetical protein
MIKQVTAICLATLFCGVAIAGPANLHVTKSKYRSPLKPKWWVSKTVVADITADNIGWGTNPSSTVRDWVQNMVGCSSPIDDAGHFVAKELGGRARYFNIMPLKPSVNRGVMSTWEKRVKKYVLEECEEARVTVTARFGMGAPKTRPVKIVYDVCCINGLKAGSPPSLPTKRWNNPKPAAC